MKNYDIFNTNIFAFHSCDNIMDSEDLGICSNMASMITQEYSVAALESFQGCPYTNSGFRFDVRVNGERFRVDKWDWLPNAIRRHGAYKALEVESITVMSYGAREAVMKLKITNNGNYDLCVPLQIQFDGCVRYDDTWTFSIPKPTNRTMVKYSIENGVLCADNEGLAYTLTCSEEMTLFELARLWEGRIAIPAHGTKEIYASCHMGTKKEALAQAVCRRVDYIGAFDTAFSKLEEECKRLFNVLPRLKSDCPELDALYYRSFVTYLMCRWEAPELFMSPYYSTGSVNGSCICSYLWDYSGGLMVHPIVDPEVNKKEILAYLGNDLTQSYALNPVDGRAIGPWYQINQEKIIRMVYYHILHTGDVDFLKEECGGKRVIDWMIYHAYVCDDIEKPVALYDYGIGGDDHLELKRGIPYNGIMPDLNARRYMNYMLVYEMTYLAGIPEELLLQRAEGLKKELKSLWNDDAKWYDFIADGKRDIRYTVQMFKFIDSPVIDEHERAGLISHLNDREFLSGFGLHSMSKVDLAYDQDDIDNGGGGICTLFTMQICAQLYARGYDEVANDILKRVLWWGTRLPYLGDSCASNMILNRPDTPLQGDISSVSCAQMIIFAMFGIRVGFDGSISISPAKKTPARKLTLSNIKLRGKEFTINVEKEEFTVSVANALYHAKIGETVVI